MDAYLIAATSGGNARDQSMDSGSDSISSEPSSIASEAYSPVLLWDWPLNADGYVRCYMSDDKFRVALDFKSLHAREIEVRTFENMRNNGFNWTVGLCQTKSKCQSFSRLEIQTNCSLKTITVEAFREIYRNLRNNGRTLKRLRKVYKLPADSDMSTVKAAVNNGHVLLEVDRKPDLALAAPTSPCSGLFRKTSMSSLSSNCSVQSSFSSGTED